MEFGKQAPQQVLLGQESLQPWIYAIWYMQIRSNMTLKEVFFNITNNKINGHTNIDCYSHAINSGFTGQ